METKENVTSSSAPRTLVEAVRYFSDVHVAHTFFAKLRWPNGAVCPRCDSTNVRYLAKYRRYQCCNRHDRRQFTIKTNTIMEDSPLGLDKWAVAFWLEANAKNSISSYEVHRALGITQKSAWFMQHRIRLAMQEQSFVKLGGEGRVVEADETYIGGKARNMHKKRREQVIHGRGGVGKTPVMGLLERHGPDRPSKIRTRVLTHVDGDTLQPLVRTNVHDGTQLCTDAHGGYRGLDDQFMHSVVDHAECYVKGNVHTNGIENFWALFKRCIKGTHISVEPFHLFRYLDAECFRFNNRKGTDATRFVDALSGMTGKRLTFRALTGSQESPPQTPRAWSA